ncbi:hypothetical protein D3C81_2147590 [compost metagenome]
MEKLKSDLESSDEHSDILGYQNYQEAIKGLPSRKTNVGYATRKLLATTFKEYFREDGEKSLGDLWLEEAQ